MARSEVEHIVNGKQTCRRCKIPKAVEAFGDNKYKKTGISIYCKPCSSIQRQETRLRIKTGTPKFIIGQYKKGTEAYKNRKKDQMLQYGYGISLEEYNLMFNKQKGCCAICKTHQSMLTKALHVDHDHDTEKVRGLLCSKCNTGLGLFNDTQETLYAALKYLEDNKTTLISNPSEN